MLCEFQVTESNNVNKVVNTVSKELTVLHLERDANLVEQPQYASDVFKVVCRPLREYDNVVQVD